MSAEELVAFQDEIKSSLNGTLPIRIALGPTDYKITVRKPGRGAKVLSSKSAAIAAFVAQRIDLDYIPAIRTAQSAVRIVEEMVARELSKLESDDQYNLALAKIAQPQGPLLEALSTTIRDTLVKFSPTCAQCG